MSITSVFARVIDDFRTTTPGRAVGDSTLELASGAGAELGALPAGRIFRLTCVLSADTIDEEILTVLESTGLSGDTLTGVTVSPGYTDVILYPGTTVDIRVCARDLSEIQDALNALENTVATIELTPGPPGEQGEPGPPGFSSGKYTQEWNWRTTTSGDPGSGKIAINTNAWSTTTEVRVSKTTSTGFNLPGGEVNLGDSIYIQVKNNANNWAEYSVSAISDSGTYMTYTVTYLDDGGGSEPGNNTNMAVSFLSEGALPITLNSTQVIGGTAGRILVEGAGPVVADSANLTFDGKAMVINSPGIGSTPILRLAGGPSDYWVTGFEVTSFGYNTQVYFVVGVDAYFAVLSAQHLMFGNGSISPITFGTNWDTAGTQRILVDAYDPASRGIVVKGAASQTAPLIALQGISATSTARDLGYVDAGFVGGDNTDASYKGYLALDVNDYNGRHKGIRIESTGVSGSSAHVIVGDTYPNNTALLTIYNGNTTYGASGLDLYNPGGGGHAVLQTLGNGIVYITDSAGSAGYIACFGWQNPSGGASFTASYGTYMVTAVDPSFPPFVVKGATSQAGNLQEWRNNTGTALASVDKDGKYHGDGSLLTGISGGGGGVPSGASGDLQFNNGSGAFAGGGPSYDVSSAMTTIPGQTTLGGSLWVGLGSVPDMTVLITSSGNAYVGVNTGTVFSKLQNIEGGGYATVGTQTNHDFRVIQNNTARAVFAASGQTTINAPVAITSPGYDTTLEIQGVSTIAYAGVTDILFTNTGVTSGTGQIAKIQGITGSTQNVGILSFSVKKLDTDTSPTQVGFFDEGGNFNINNGNIYCIGSAGATIQASTFETSGANASILFHRRDTGVQQWQIFSQYGILSHYNITTGTHALSINDTDNTVTAVASVTSPKFIGANSGADYFLQCGTMGIQSYATNNCWLADNIYYNGNWLYKDNGFGVQLYFTAGDFSLRTAPNNLTGPGTIASIQEVFKVSNAGSAYVTAPTGNAALVLNNATSGSQAQVLFEDGGTPQYALKTNGSFGIGLYDYAASTNVWSATPGNKLGFYGAPPVAQPSGDLLAGLLAQGLNSAPNLRNGSVSLSSAYNIISNTTWESIGLFILLPAAGFYLINSNFRTVLQVHSGSYAETFVRLYNITNAAAISASVRHTAWDPQCIGKPSSQQTHTSFTWFVSIAGPVTLEIQMQISTDASIDTAQAASDAQGMTNLSYIKIG